MKTTKQGAESPITDSFKHDRQLKGCILTILFFEGHKHDQGMMDLDTLYKYEALNGSCSKDSLYDLLIQLEREYVLLTTYRPQPSNSKSNVKWAIYNQLWRHANSPKIKLRLP